MSNSTSAAVVNVSTPREIAERITRQARVLGGCHAIDKGARRNIGIDADRLASRLEAAEAALARVAVLDADEIRHDT